LDQLFTDQKFESYRGLGFASACAAVQGLRSYQGAKSA
jgi:hypothetical protein